MLQESGGRECTLDCQYQRLWSILILTHWQQCKNCWNNKSLSPKTPLAPGWCWSPGKLGSERGILLLPPGALDLWVALNFFFCTQLLFTLSSPKPPKGRRQHWYQLFPTDICGTASILWGKRNIFNPLSMLQAWSVMESKYFHPKLQALDIRYFLDLPA